MQRPTGVVTFLFTDVEGSSKLWDAHGRDMADAMRLHDRVVGGSIESHGGYVFTTAGDSFAAAFDRPEEAVEAALEVHASLASADWGSLASLKVRIGMHTGTADERDGDYFGPTLNRAARLTDLAHGGQTIMSLSTEELLGDGRHPGWHFRDLGRYHLKDLMRPERVFQLSTADDLREFPPLRAAARTPNNLPTMLSSFIGRADELDRLLVLLESTRLLTITGVGGSGKSRLGLRIAELSTSTYTDGVWFVELAPLTDPDDIASTVATAMGIDRSRLPGDERRLETSAMDLIKRSVGTSHTLIVLDNCEHLAVDAAQWASEVLRGCPHLTIIATSREGLALPGETLWQVPPLAIEGGDDRETGDCVDLFLERAREVGFSLGAGDDASEVATIGEICRRLDGIPLAVELAAVQTSFMTPAQILERLSERFDILTGGTRASLARHQTLEATVDWSYQLLSEGDREVFAGLAVFRGGFTLAAAESVLNANGNEPVVGAVRRLAAKSMIQFDRSRGRFTMLETMRQFALRKMMDSGNHKGLRKRHLEYFDDYAERLRSLVFTADEIAAAHAMVDDHDNMRIAIDFGLASGNDTGAARVLAGIAPLYFSGSGDSDEWLDYLDRVDLDRAALDSGTELRLLARACGLGRRSRPDAATSYFERLDELASSSPHPLARSWRALAWMDVMPFEGVESLYGAARIWADEAERAGHTEMLGWAHHDVALFARRVGDLDEAHRALDRSLAAFRVTGEHYGRAAAHHQLGHLHRASWNFAAAIDHYDHGIELLEDLDGLLLAYLVGSKAIVQSVLGDVSGSLDSLAMIEQTLTGPGSYSLAEAHSLIADLRAAAGDEDAARAACMAAIDDPYMDAESFFDAATAVLVTCEGSDEDRARLLGWLDDVDRRIMPIELAVIEKQKRPKLELALGSGLPDLLEEGRPMSIPDLQTVARRVVEQSPAVTLRWETEPAT